EMVVQSATGAETSDPPGGWRGGSAGLDARPPGGRFTCDAWGMSIGEGLLAGVRVLDLSIWRPGPYATQLLAELGADVLKVEPPDGDPMRSYPALFESLNVNKRSIVLDLKRDAHRARALTLIAAADVLVEGFRP